MVILFKNTKMFYERNHSDTLKKKTRVLLLLDTLLVTKILLIGRELIGGGWKEGKTYIEPKITTKGCSNNPEHTTKHAPSCWSVRNAAVASADTQFVLWAIDFRVCGAASEGAEQERRSFGPNRLWVCSVRVCAEAEKCMRGMVAKRCRGVST